MKETLTPLGRVIGNPEKWWPIADIGTELELGDDDVALCWLPVVQLLDK